MSIGNLKDLEYELRRRELEDPLALVYTPHDGQIQAHKASKPIRLVLGGNRTGKSVFAVCDSILTALGRRTYRNCKEPPVTIWYILPSMGMFDRVILPLLRQFVPRKHVIPTMTGDIVTKKDPKIRFKNGSVIHFLSADMRQRRLQGAEIDAIYIDETPDEEVYLECVARVQHTRGSVTMVFSPIDAKTFWVRDKIYIPWMSGEKMDIDVILMPVADKEGNPLVPHFTREDIQRMERMYADPNVRAARMYGEFITRTGLVFRSYDAAVHLIEPFVIPKSFTRWWVVDPQYHRFAALYMAADEHGNYYISDEYFSQDDSLANRCERMQAVTGRKDRSIPVYVDSANPTDMMELNWHFQRLGAPMGAVPIPVKKDVDKFVLRVHSLLEPAEERTYPPCIPNKLNVHGAPRLFIFNNIGSTWRWEERDMRCSRLIWEMARLSWGDNQKPDKDSADGADATDALIYGCSIIQQGLIVEQVKDWKKDLSVQDTLLWMAIERQDNANRVLREREW